MRTEHALAAPARFAGRDYARRRGSSAGRIARALVVAALAASALTWAVHRSPLWVAAQFTRAQFFLAGIHERSLQVDGVELRYVEGGAGDPVVLVHGLGGSSHLDWAELMPQLVRSGFHTYAMDLPGFGDSAKPADRSYSIAEQARLVEHFLDALHLDRVALAGESMGGWIASKVALEQNRRVSRLVLFDSAGLRFEPAFDLGLLTPQTPRQVDALLDLLVPNADPLPDYVKADLIRESQRDGWVIRKALASMMTGADLLDARFSALKLPLLIVWGKQDALTPLALAERLHRAAPQSVLQIFDGCGHISVKTCGDRVGPATATFLAATAPLLGARLEVPAANLQ